MLILARSTCEACRAYERELRRLLAAGPVEGIEAIGKLILDQPGSSKFKRDNPWIQTIDYLPYTVVFRRGERVDAFATSQGTYLMDRIRRLRASSRR